MQFNDKLNEYIEELDISSKELAEESELSPSVISRYRTGTRIPTEDSQQFEQLVYALSKIGKRKSHNNPDRWNPALISSELAETLDRSGHYYKHVPHNLNMLINSLHINAADMAKAVGYDASYISRIRNGQRLPANTEAFVDNISSYVVKNHSTASDIEALADLMNLSANSLSDSITRQSLISGWLIEQQMEDLPSSVHHFLSEVDSFDLDNYMRKIHFKDIKVPSMPFSLPAARNYYGIDAMKQGELDFLKATVLSRSRKPVYMYSDMPMSDMGSDEEFKKKYILGLGLIIKKGLHMNIIHNINRPFAEMMIGLEGWIPLYMTGQISPYYFRDTANNVFCHLNNVSGTVALTGECVDEFHNNGKYYITNNKREVNYYLKRANDMIEKASPLINIYQSDNADDLYAFIDENVLTRSNRKRISYSLPLFTISDELLSRILTRNNIPREDQQMILRHVEKQRSLINTMIERGSLTDIAFNISPDEFHNFPPSLSLNTMFYGRNITYSLEEYRLHLDETMSYAKHHNSYSFIQTNNYSFRNIQIKINPNHHVIISKDRSPAIHFVVQHPLLRDAIEKLIQN